jgi:hypothetical protein
MTRGWEMRTKGRRRSRQWRMENKRLESEEKMEGEGADSRGLRARG